jgi:hypothetical protein
MDTGAPTAVTGILINWAAGLGVGELPGLKVHQPSLEDVYLRMITERAIGTAPAGEQEIAS